ncbi:MAG: Asp23/Gls24 family envelope stress response protein [Syntrophomonadaceae bacterium]|nr:Asp23/Gls24 family envelope stress response protein [Syntrophomonadaceae bacterium]MDD3888511.1 Asp23/Gls24 family envelope stress response protein [Syntrophomonadaceae bacterium]MDD4548751.1 Asp23/Gls24 family envelope stress response protein [Syntrophomonadaceae bacterium]
METQKPEINNELGSIKIADEVVSTIAGLAAIEVEGVASMSGGWGTDLVEKLGRKNFGKGIKVDVNDDQTIIDIYIVVEFGYAIPAVAENVQREVKVAVETMTGLNVATINVHIIAVSMKKGNADEEQGEFAVE